MKKGIALVLSTIVVLQTAACTSQAPAPAPAATPAPAAATPAAPASGKEKAEIWTWLSGQEVAIKMYNEMQDELEIELVQMVHTDIAQKMLIALSAGSGAPDMFQQPQRTFSNISKTEKLMDLGEYIKGHEDKFPPALLGLASFNGKLYGLTPDTSPGVLWYRSDIFKENGIGEIKTWGEFVSAGEKLAAKDYYIMPIFNPAGSWGANAIAMFLQSRGGNFFTEDGKVIHDNKELEFVLGWFNDMLKNGYGEGLTFFTPEFWGEFKASNIVAWPMNIAEGNNLKKNAPELEGKWDVAPFPKWDDKSETLTGYWGGTAIGIPAMLPVKEKAAKYVQWLCTTTEGQKAMYDSWGSVPSNTEAAKDPYFQNGDPYFSGSNPLAKVNKLTPFYYFDFAQEESHVGEQVDLMFAGKITPVEAARAIEASIAKETGR